MYLFIETAHQLPAVYLSGMGDLLDDLWSVYTWAYDSLSTVICLCPGLNPQEIKCKFYLWVLVNGSQTIWWVFKSCLFTKLNMGEKEPVLISYLFRCFEF